MHTQTIVRGGTPLEQELAKFIQENEGNDGIDRIIRKKLVKVALVLTRGNQSEAARILGINRGTLRKVMKG